MTTDRDSLAKVQAEIAAVIRDYLTDEAVGSPSFHATALTYRLGALLDAVRAEGAAQMRNAIDEACRYHGWETSEGLDVVECLSLRAALDGHDTCQHRYPDGTRCTLSTPALAAATQRHRRE